jgi:hypothetical protein
MSGKSKMMMRRRRSRRTRRRRRRRKGMMVWLWLHAIMNLKAFDTTRGRFA